jgi:MFS family permease
MGACLLGRQYLVTLYLQGVLAYSPLAAGVALIPGNVVTAVVSILFIHKIVARTGPKAPTVIGLTLMTASLVVMLPISPHSTYVRDILPGMLLMGLGVGLLFMPSVSIVMSAVAPSDTGVASGVSNLSTQMGGSIGVAALAVVSASRTASLAAHHEPLASALTDGYRLGFLVSAAFGCLSVLLAVALLHPERRAPVPVRAGTELSRVGGHRRLGQ